MQEMRAVNVVSLFSATKTMSNYYLVLEHCNGGDLEGFLKARGGYLQEAEVNIILKQIVIGLQAIKEQNVMHRDLKLANILIHFPGLSRERASAPDFNMKEFLSSVVIVPGEEG